MMKWILSGYSGFAFCNDAQILWSDPAAAPSYWVEGDGCLFLAEEFSGKAAVRLYKQQGDSWTLKDRREISGGELCHLAYSSKNRALLGACYGDGIIFSLGVDPESGTFGTLHSCFSQGNGLTRAHCVVLNQAEDTVYSANIAQDRIYRYSISGGILKETGFFPLPQGVGPRHLALREDLGKIYAVTEYSSEIITLNLDNGEVLSRNSILRPDFHGESYGSTLAFSPDGRFLYAANRGENTLAVFAVDDRGNLSISSRQSCFGDWPRDFALMKQGTMVGITNQKSGEAVLCPRNPETGEIGDPLWRIPFPEASCIREIQGV